MNVMINIKINEDYDVIELKFYISYHTISTILSIYIRKYTVYNFFHKPSMILKLKLKKKKDEQLFEKSRIIWI